MKSVVMARSALFVLVLAFVLSAAPAFAQAAAHAGCAAAGTSGPGAPAAGRVPARRQDRPREPAADRAALGRRQGVDGESPGAHYQEAGRGRGEGQAAAGQSEQAAAEWCADERDRPRAARKGHRASDRWSSSASSRTRRPRSPSCRPSFRATSRRSCFRFSTRWCVEKGLQVLLSAADAGIIAADPGIDLTLEAIKRFDAATAAKAAAPAAAPTAKPAAPTAKPAAPATPAPKP